MQPVNIANRQDGALAQYKANPLISPLANFHGRVVQTFDPLPAGQKIRTVLERIAIAAIGAFAYLILGIVALAGLTINAKYKALPQAALPAPERQPAPHPIARPALPSLALPASGAPVEGLPRATSAEPIESGKEGVPNVPLVEVLQPPQTGVKRLIQVGKRMIPARIRPKPAIPQAIPLPNAKPVLVQS